MKNYRVLANRETAATATSYLEQLQAGNIPGRYLQDRLKDVDIHQISIVEFIELLIRTKRPQIFAEFEVYGNGTDWNHEELSILGDISIVTPVTVYDNGRPRHPDLHEIPFAATLIFTPGALLRNGNNITPVDWEEVVIDGEINIDRYYRLYERRFLPAFIYANQLAQQNGKMALITMPGMGCGQFAGIFKGQLGAALKQTLITFLETHGSNFPNIKVVYYDPYGECENERIEIDGISLFVRPLTQGNANKPQLCQPETYAEDGDEFSDLELFSFVAWDHVSWPGNDFYLGARSTDDGVKAAATNVMAVMTGIEGRYDSLLTKYCPPANYQTWKEVIVKDKIKLEVVTNLIILPSIEPQSRGNS
jgi:hypothetical protein